MRVAPSGIGPFLLHHHAAFENGRLLEQGRAARTRAAIAHVNSAIESFCQRHLRHRIAAFPLDVIPRLPASVTRP